MGLFQSVPASCLLSFSPLSSSEDEPPVGRQNERENLFVEQQEMSLQPKFYDQKQIWCKKADNSFQLKKLKEWKEIPPCNVYNKEEMFNLKDREMSIYQTHRNGGFGLLKETDMRFICALGIEHRRWFSVYIHYTQCEPDEKCAELARVSVLMYQRMIEPRIELRGPVFVPKPVVDKIEKEINFPDVPKTPVESNNPKGPNNNNNNNNNNNGGGGIALLANLPSSKNGIQFID